MNFRNQNLTSGIVIFACIFVLILLNVFVPKNMGAITLGNEDPIDKLVQEASSTLDQSLPYSHYKSLQDSIREKIYYDNMPSSGSRMMISSFGVQKIKKQNQDEQYFLAIPGYFIHDFIQFYAKDSQHYLKYFNWGKENQNGVRTGEEVLLPTTLHIERNPDDKNREWIIGIPISKTAFRTWNVIITTLLGVLLLIAFYVLLFIPLRFLLLLAKGQAFNNETLGYLFTISTFLILFGLLDSLITLATHLYFEQQVSEAFNFYYFNDIMKGWKCMVAGLIVLLFAKAFLNGLSLQEEQKLIV